MRLKKSTKRLISIIFAVVCLIVLAVPALAGDEIDPGHTGSVSVKIRAYATDDAVGGGSLDLYHIAETTITETEGAVYRYTEDFSGCSEDLLGEDKIALAETAEIFEEWADEKGIKAEKTADVSADGKAYFADLSVGVYLITQNTAAEGYNEINAFLVTVPILEDGAWIYDVDATPKTSPVTEKEEPKKDEPGTGQPEPGSPDGNGGDGGITGAGGGRTGDYNWYFYGAVVIGAAVVIALALRRKTRHEAQ